MNSPNPAPAASSPPKKSFPVWIVVLLVVLGGGLVLVLSLGVIAIFGVRKYIANAKAAEARNSLAMIGRDASAMYEASAATPERRTLCASASAPVPDDANKVRGMKYQSVPTDWLVDEKRNAGFACLKFEMSSPQYFQYNYQSSGGKMTATARGDLNGDGVASTYELEGRVTSGIFVVAPALMETNPDE